MKYSLHFKEETLVDVTEIANWYNEIRKELGKEFLAELEFCIHKIKENPYNYQVQKKEIRQAIFK